MNENDIKEIRKKIANLREQMKDDADFYLGMVFIIGVPLIGLIILMLCTEF